MLTQIGRVVVFTGSYRRNGWVLWETAVVAYFPNSEGHWCYAEPRVEVFDRYLTQAESWIGHALIVGYVRVGLELEPAPRVPAVVHIGATFRGLLAQAMGLQVEAAPAPLAPEPHVKSA